jgi:hypothetical protein
MVQGMQSPTHRRCVDTTARKAVPERTLYIVV